MRIKSVKITNEKLLLKGKRGDSFLKDGVYRSDDGVSLTVRGNMIVSMLSVPNIAKAPKEQLQEYIDELEQEMRSAENDARQANIDLQHSLNRQAQTIQTISNFSKMLHDIAKSVIDNMR